MPEPVKKVVIVGGGTAGWMTAAWLSKFLRETIDQITLVESDEIATVGVGEATIPSIRKYNQWLGIDEDLMLAKAFGTFKLGIEFVDWGYLGNRYHHSFGPYGREMGNLPFHAFWLRHYLENEDDCLADYSLQTQASLAGRFQRPEGSNSPLATITYAFQFDALLYARFLREISEKQQTIRVEGKIDRVCLRPDDGWIEAVELADGRRVEGDLFIDCSGFRSMLLTALDVGFVDWSHWLPCDRALAVPSERTSPLLPFTRSTAQSAGWQWRIPLQHRTGNGHVFSSAFMTDDEAHAILLDQLDAPALAEPRMLKFSAGHRSSFWTKNCVAIGLAAGFLEPLESTSIFLIQNAIARLHVLFPDTGFEAADIAFFNRECIKEYEDVRDFLILHYKLGRRSDSEFWGYCTNMEIPERLQQRMELFKSRGRIFEQKGEQFGLTSWLAVMWGQGLRPAASDPLTRHIDPQKLARWLSDTRTVISECCDHMPLHATYIDAHCRARMQEPGK